MTASNHATPDALLGAVRQTRRRMLLQRGLNRTFGALPWLLIYATLGTAFVKLTDPPMDVVRWVMWGLSLPVLGLLLAWVWRSVVATRRDGLILDAAVRLDRYHRLEGRIANGVAFAGKVQRTTLEDCALDDAVASAYTLRPALAVPLAVPRNVGVSIACGIGLAVLVGVEVRHEIEVELVTNPPATFEPFTLASDDQAYLEEEVSKMGKLAQSADTVQVVDQVNLLMADLRAGRLDRNAALERLSAIERALTESTDLEREARKEGLAELGAGLQKSRASKAIGDALAQHRLADAEKALRDLANSVRSNKVSRQDLDRLRAALEKASRGNEERLARLEAERTALREKRGRLLNKHNQKQSPAEAAATDRELRNTDRDLKRLDRQQRKAESAAKQLSALDRELAQAASELLKEMGDAAGRLEKGAEQLSRTRQKELSDDEKQALKKQMQELKEMLRQAKSGSADRQKQLDKFRKRAAGNNGQQPDGSGDPTGKPGGTSPKLSLGQGQGGDIPIPMPGKSPGQGGEGEGTGPSPGHSPGGDVAGKSSDLKGKTQDVAAAGIDSGQGASASEVVFGAAARGFAGADYRKVYTDYKTVAEEALTNDEIPSGYKFYVRRYFQLIRPRE